MPNIAINNYCNLKCPYCFADDMIKEENKFMTLDNYKKVIKYITENKGGRIGIIGGEPTLHPLFKQILIETNQCCNATHTSALIFTNGINLEQFIPYIGTHINILINYNNPNNMTLEQKIKLELTMKHLQELGWFYNEKVKIGCNLYLDCQDYSWIWEAVNNYEIKNIRLSVVSPGGIYTDWRTKKHEYFTKMKPIFLDFIKIIKEKKLGVTLDCGHIPACYFTQEELDLISNVSGKKYELFNCSPVMDITPDLQVTTCFGAYDPIPLNFDWNLTGLHRYLTQCYSIPKALNNNQDKCAQCKNLQDFQCQGGCLAFSSPE